MFVYLLLLTLLNTAISYRPLAAREKIGIGIILKEGDDNVEKIIDNVFWRILTHDRRYIPLPIPYRVIKEKVPYEDALQYQKAVCSLLSKGVGVVLTSTEPSYYPILAGYSNEYNLSLVSPAVPEFLDDPTSPDAFARLAVGIRPSTTRPILDLIRDLRWKEIVYIYDEYHNPERLQVMFRIGYTALKLKLLNFGKVETAEEANRILKDLDKPGSFNSINVILDTTAEMAKDILQLHVHSGVRKTQYQFLLTEPTLENFWTSYEFAAVKIFGFLALPPNYDRVGNENEEWKKLLGDQSSANTTNLNIYDYYYHDAAVYLSQAVIAMWRQHLINDYSQQILHKNRCYNGPTDNRVAQTIRTMDMEHGLTGKLRFWNPKGIRDYINLTIIESTHHGFLEYGSWSNSGNYGGISKAHNARKQKPEALPQISGKQYLRITTIINPPYMMLKKSDNKTELFGNDRFEGYCKDIIDIMCEMIQIRCDIDLVEDATYGRFDSKTSSKWSGMIGEILRGKADIAAGDLIVTGQRQRVVDFTAPIQGLNLGLVMKNPDLVRSKSSMFLVFNAFSVGVWICIIISAIIFSVLFHFITMYTGAPDSFESAAGLWGRKNKVSMNVWFIIGSSMMQATGIYPRSISSRILAVGWWMSTSIFICFFIASLTTQLQDKTGGDGGRSLKLEQLKSLSLESIILESLEKGWPKVGIVSNSYTIPFIKKSSLPIYQRLDKFLQDNPDAMLANREEGIKRVSESDGSFMLLMESTGCDYVIRQRPCDLIAVQDNVNFASLGFALSTVLDPAITGNITLAFNNMEVDGVFGHLHRKWWIDSSQCKKGYIESSADPDVMQMLSGICILFFGGLAVLLIIFGIQFARRIRDHESRMHKLTFEDMNLDNRLPTPPPELLHQPPPVLNVPEIEGRALITPRDPETFNDFFERMRADP